MAELDVRRFPTKIGNRHFVIKASKSNEHMQAVSDAVNDRLQKIGRQNTALKTDERALLLAVNLMSDLIEAQDELTQLRRDNNVLLNKHENRDREFKQLEEMLANNTRENDQLQANLKALNADQERMQDQMNILLQAIAMKEDQVQAEQMTSQDIQKDSSEPGQDTNDQKSQINQSDQLTGHSQDNRSRASKNTQGPIAVDQSNHVNRKYHINQGLNPNFDMDTLIKANGSPRSHLQQTPRD
ncbi:hypothetical protein AWM75_01280 [Aerococcus urinaehominis]|uniref:Uncharacterized protein n=1 Tax=Aerococcus urinaehominis TaxID=128944 RepID=A0A120IAP2_9LACT|nr:cell division protein ZapA [Aerococcus urinaehominis]AMB98709.1 hypothetical protein AWM75_01280 [Aerococcus urinaehominis]SDL99523.1 hypothetical protein SAMN04487985_103116 [Aerococcus urinaehominis]